MEIRPIGVIRSPHKQAQGAPIQAALAAGISGTVEVLPEYAPGLKDIEGFDRIWLVYWFDRAKELRLEVIPYLDTVAHGLFATRAPSRPNPIGLSCVRLLQVRGNILDVDGVDVLDGTPLLDIKPYVPSFDAFEAKRIGWFAGVSGKSVRADGRFETGAEEGHE